MSDLSQTSILWARTARGCLCALVPTLVWGHTAEPVTMSLGSLQNTDLHEPSAWGMVHSRGGRRGPGQHPRVMQSSSWLPHPVPLVYAAGKAATSGVPSIYAPSTYAYLSPTKTPPPPPTMIPMGPIHNGYPGDFDRNSSGEPWTGGTQGGDGGGVVLEGRVDKGVREELGTY